MYLGLQLHVLILKKIADHLLPHGVIIESLPLLLDVSWAHPANLQVKSTWVFVIHLRGEAGLLGDAKLHIVTNAIRGSWPLLKHKVSWGHSVVIVLRWWSLHVGWILLHHGWHLLVAVLLLIWIQLLQRLLLLSPSKAPAVRSVGIFETAPYSPTGFGTCRSHLVTIIVVLTAPDYTCRIGAPLQGIQPALPIDVVAVHLYE